MSVLSSKLQNKLAQVEAAIKLPDFQKAAGELQKNAGKLQSTLDQLPKVVGQVNNNVMNLSNISADFKVKLVGADIQGALKNATTMAQNLQNVMPELQKPLSMIAEGGSLDVKVKIDISSAASDLQKITETVFESGFNDLVVGLGTAQGVLNQMKNMSSTLQGLLASNDLLGVAQKLGGPDVQNLLSTAGDLLKIDVKGELLGKLDGELGKVQKAFGDVVKNITNSPILDVVHDLNQTVSLISADIDIPKNLAQTALNVLTNKGGVPEALKLLKAEVNISVPELEAKLNEINRVMVPLSNLIQSDVPVDLSPIVLDLGNIKKDAAEGIFRFIRSSDEIKGDLLSSLREVDSVVIHWSETHMDQDITAADLDNLNPEGIPYHFIIRKDGGIQRGKPIDQKGKHTDTAIDETSIAVLIVGGYDGYLGDENAKLTSASFNREQMNSLETTIKALLGAKPGLKIYGKGEIDGTQEPGFDVDEFVKNKTNTSLTAKPKPETPPNPSSLGIPQTKSSDPKVKGKVRYGFGPNTIRNDPIQPSLMAILESVAFSENVDILITSGGQLPNDPVNVPGGRTGTARHDYGWAADMVIKDAITGQWLDFGVNNPPEKVKQVYQALVNAGATAIGAGPGYMFSKDLGVHAIHVDIAYGRNAAGSGTRWGKKGQPPASYIV